jgi:hypothetical protein
VIPFSRRLIKFKVSEGEGKPLVTHGDWRRLADGRTNKLPSIGDVDRLNGLGCR